MEKPRGSRCGVIFLLAARLSLFSERSVHSPSALLIMFSVFTERLGGSDGATAGGVAYSHLCGGDAGASGGNVPDPPGAARAAHPGPGLAEPDAWTRPGSAQSLERSVRKVR